jgi:hypothetical protein
MCICCCFPICSCNPHTPVSVPTATHAHVSLNCLLLLQPIDATRPHLSLSHEILSQPLSIWCSWARCSRPRGFERAKMFLPLFTWYKSPRPVSCVDTFMFCSIVRQGNRAEQELINIRSELGRIVAQGLTGGSSWSGRATHAGHHPVVDYPLGSCEAEQSA